MNNFFSSDWHLSHKKILQFDNRPFSSIEEHDNAIINNYNELVRPDDNFYFLGDFAFGDIKKAEEFMKRLMGNKFFIKGNHDHEDMVEIYKKYGTYLGEQCKIKLVGDGNGQEIVLNHYKMAIWERAHRFSWHLYGHSHHSLKDDLTSKSLDVGINGWDYKPLSFKDIKREMDKRTFIPKDHHKGRNSTDL